MKRGILTAVLVLFGLTSRAPADEPPKAAVPGPWKFSCTTGLNLSQSSFSGNWSGGDKGSIVWVLNANLKGERQLSTKFNWSNVLQLAYGATLQQTADP